MQKPIPRSCWVRYNHFINIAEATLSNKVDVRAKKINERQREVLHNDKRISPPGR
jgi:hypothetical protein